MRKTMALLTSVALLSVAAPNVARAASTVVTITGPVTGNFYSYPGSQANFGKVTIGTDPAAVSKFVETFNSGVINFDPPTNTCTPALSPIVNDTTTPFADVVQSSLGGPCTVQYAKSGNTATPILAPGELGAGSTGSGHELSPGEPGNANPFQALFSGTFSAAGPGDVTFKLTSDDAAFLTIQPSSGGGSATSNGVGSFNLPAQDPLDNTYKVIGGADRAQSVNTETFTVSFSAAGAYKFHIYYTEFNNSPLSLTITPGNVIPTGPNNTPEAPSVVLFGAGALGVFAFGRRMRRRPQLTLKA